MTLVTFTKKKIKRTVALASMVTAAIAVGAVAVFTSVGTQAQERKLPIYNVERGDNKIALTFDVAWENSNTSELIEILDEFDAQATFFVTGDWCDRYPEDVMMFYEAGHEIQNHSDQHPHVEGINVNELITDTKACSQKIQMITGEEPTLYRAPYGEYDDNLITTIEGMGLKPIQWDVDSIDWKEPPAQDIVDRVLEGAKSGSILLFHNDLKNTTEALPDILTALRDEGYQFVTVSDLIYWEDYTIDSNGTQIPVSKSSLDITPENVEQVMSQYSDDIIAAGLPMDQVLAAVEAIKAGSEIPEEILAVISQNVHTTTAEATSDAPIINDATK